MIGKTIKESSEIIKSLDFQDRMDFLMENKKALISQKKESIKHADCVVTVKPSQSADKSIVANKTDLTKLDSIEVTVVGNTCMVMDSHDDVQINGCWKKTLNEGQDKFYHTKNHSGAVDDYIGQHIKTYTEKVNTNKFNINTDVKDVEILLMKSNVLKALDEKMFTQYALGMVKQHSVGMLYYKVRLALNDPNKEKEYATYQKYYPQILNKEYVDENGFYWAVEESGLLEISAVTRGSNSLTPTYEVKYSEPTNVTHENKNKTEPTVVTQTAPSKEQLKEIINELKFN